ncbi:MAG: 50S ribosomal protein L21 [Pirellulales bacterium]
MYAIIVEDGRQYRVEEGQELIVHEREAEVGATVTFSNVLAISGQEGLKLGKPLVAGASVTAEVLGPVAGPKLVVQKFRRRKNYRRRNGHRQHFTKVRISKISA